MPLLVQKPFTDLDVYPEFDLFWTAVKEYKKKFDEALARGTGDFLTLRKRMIDLALPYKSQFISLWNDALKKGNKWVQQIDDFESIFNL